MVEVSSVYSPSRFKCLSHWYGVRGCVSISLDDLSSVSSLKNGLAFKGKTLKPGHCQFKQRAFVRERERVTSSRATRLPFLIVEFESTIDASSFFDSWTLMTCWKWWAMKNIYLNKNLLLRSSPWCKIWLWWLLSSAPFDEYAPGLGLQQ